MAYSGGGNNASLTDSSSGAITPGAAFTSDRQPEVTSSGGDPSTPLTTIVTSLVSAVLDGTAGQASVPADAGGGPFADYGASSPVESTPTSVGPPTTSTSASAAAVPTQRLEATLTGWITGAQNMSRLHGGYNLYVLYATFGLMLVCFLLLVCWVQCKKRLLLLRYERLPASDERRPDFVYKPSHGGLLDDEYENTFVGVSIPILQDVTKL